MGIFKQLGGTSPTVDPLDSAVEQAIASDLASSWDRVPMAWRQSATQEQVADFLEGVAARAIKQHPAVPQQALLLFLLESAHSVLTTGGSSGGGGTSPVTISQVSGNLIEMYADGLYATLRKVDGGTFN